MATPFSKMSHRAQVSRLRVLGLEALRAYPIVVTRVSLLRHLWNTTFRVVAADGERYVLRIHHPEQTSVAMVESEMLWLAALRQQTRLVVPEPVYTRTGRLVSVESTAEIDQPRLAVLFRWIDGRFVYRRLAPAHLFEVGKMTAHLHRHAAEWQRPADFMRIRVDNLFVYPRVRNDCFEEAIAVRAVELVGSAISTEGAAIVQEAIHRVWNVVGDLGQHPEVFGLIHADLHQRNYLFRRGEAAAIDFDDCGTGHRLYDLAVTLNEAPDDRAMREALIAGYREIAHLSNEHERLVDTFIALRRIQDVLGMIVDREHPGLRERWRTIAMGSLGQLQEFIQL